CHKDIEKVYALAQMTFERQKKRIPFSLETLKNIDSACAAKNCRKTFFAKDEKGEIQAALYIVWDENSAYYLVSGANPEYRNSGAGSLLTWEAIKFASTITKRFDFEGSIIEPIERFFRSFGSVQKPFFNITKTNSIVLKILKLFISKNNIKKVANIIRLKN
ncbi:MAG: GNAT family N-acetyltransferase, partial [Candidatus Omnitrophica bacterium]|nr:GNAT family N-acetyltransferase [Candidatus Omnitrophota bacterium]